MSKFIFDNGEELIDIITGFTGIVMCRVDYISGCNRYGLMDKSLDKDGKVQKWEYFDEQLLKKSKKKKIIPENAKPGGGENPPQIQEIDK